MPLTPFTTFSRDPQRGAKHRQRSATRPGYTLAFFAKLILFAIPIRFILPLGCTSARDPCEPSTDLPGMRNMIAELMPSADYVHRVYRMRYFWWSLVVNDLKKRYRHSFLGIAWSLGRPIFLTVVLSVIFSVPLLKQGPREYAPFVFLSIALWQFIIETITSGCQAFRYGGQYIRQRPLPLAIFPLRAVLGTTIHAGLALLVALALIAFCKGMPTPLMLFAALPGMLLLFLTAFAMATIMGILHTYFADTQHLMEIVLQALFYVTPIMFPPNAFPERPRLTLFLNWNPLTALLEMLRQPLLQGEWPGMFHVLYASLSVLLLCGVAWFCLRRVEKTLVYWVS